MGRNTTRFCEKHEQDYELVCGKWRCRKCHQEWRRGRYKYSVTPEQARRYSDKKLYGISYEESDRLRSIESCQVCGSDDRLVIDHCHTTGTVRGVLCTPCNLILGHAKDNPDTLRALALYLEK